MTQERNKFCLLTRSGSDGKIVAKLLIPKSRGAEMQSYELFTGDSLNEIRRKIRRAKFHGPLTFVKLPSYDAQR